MTADSYVKQIVKKIKCSRQKRQEIRRQLLADVTAAMQQGETIEAIVLRMGEPAAIAEEFNQNLSEKERRNYKKSIAAKVISGIVVAAALLLLAVSWFLPSAAEIGSSGLYTAEHIEEQSKEIIKLFDEEDYAAIKKISTKQMQQVLNKETIDKAKAQAGKEWGGFQEFGKCYMQEVRQMGQAQAIVQINAAYEKIGITYTLIFDNHGKLAGFYIK